MIMVRADESYHCAAAAVGLEGLECRLGVCGASVSGPSSDLDYGLVPDVVCPELSCAEAKGALQA